MTKTGNTFSKYAKKESANVRRCIKLNKQNLEPKKEYVTQKKQQNKRLKPTEAEDDEVKVNGRPAPKPKNIKSFPVYEILPETTNFVHLIDAGMFSRLLYPNPVCFLTTIDTDGAKRNVMPISWLTPANNYGNFIFVIHKTRHSAFNLVTNKTFNLSIANASHVELLSNVGKFSGKSKDKFDGSVPNLAVTQFGKFSPEVAAENTSLAAHQKWHYVDSKVKDTITKQKVKSTSVNAFGALGDDSSSDEEEEQQEDAVESDGEEESKEIETESAVVDATTTSVNEATVDVAASTAAVDTLTPGSTIGLKKKLISDAMFISTSVAHLKCTVQSVADAADPGHYLVIASITDAAVHPQYWTHNGKCLAPENKDLPPLLSFLGSQQFGATVSL